MKSRGALYMWSCADSGTLVYENTGVAMKHPKKGLFVSTGCDKHGRISLKF